MKEIPRIPGTAKDTIKKLLAHKNTVKKYETIKNAIPEVAVTPASETHLQLLDYEGGFVLGGSYAEEKKEEEAEESDEEEMEDFENQIDHEQSLRGDVFCKFLLFFFCCSEEKYRLRCLWVSNNIDHIIGTTAVHVIPNRKIMT